MFLVLEPITMERTITGTKELIIFFSQIFDEYESFVIIISNNSILYYIATKIELGDPFRENDYH